MPITIDPSTLLNNYISKIVEQGKAILSPKPTPTGQPLSNLQLNQATTGGGARPGPSPAPVALKPLSNLQLNQATTGGGTRVPSQASARGISGLKSGLLGAGLGIAFNKFAMPQAHALGRYVGLSEDGLLGSMFSKEDRIALQRRQGKTGGLPDDYRKTEQTAGETADKHRPGAGFTSVRPSAGDGDGNVISESNDNNLPSMSEINESLGINLRHPSLAGTPSSGDGQLQEWTTDDPIDKPAVPIDSAISRGIKIGEDGLPVNDPFFAYDGPHGALGALRAKEANFNIVNAAGGERGGIGGSKWIHDGDKLIAISNEDAQNIMGKTITPQDFLENKLSALNSPTVDSVDEVETSTGELKEWNTDMGINDPAVKYLY